MNGAERTIKRQKRKQNFVPIEDRVKAGKNGISRVLFADWDKKTIQHGIETSVFTIALSAACPDNILRVEHDGLHLQSFVLFLLYGAHPPFMNGC